MNNLEVKKSDKVEDKSYFKIFLMCILYGKIRFFNFRIAAGITVLLLILLAGTSGASPPPAILKINGNEQTSGIGSSCWKVENETYSLCLDTVGIITPTEPLPARSPFTAHLRLPLRESPAEAGFSATRVTDDDELKEVGNNVRAWRFKGKAGNWNNLPKEPEPDINLSLEPGLYVMNVFVKWEGKGDVSYGFLVKVYDPVTEDITQATAANKSEKSATSSPNETHNMIPTEKAAGFQFALAITILLAVCIAGRKRR